MASISFVVTSTAMNQTITFDLSDQDIQRIGDWAERQAHYNTMPDPTEEDENATRPATREEAIANAISGTMKGIVANVERDEKQHNMVVPDITPIVAELV